MKTYTKKELDKILKLHILWLQDNLNGVRANLHLANLYGADLGGADLSFADLSFTTLQSADLGGADLRSANLRGADLRSANLRGADLSFADLSFANTDKRYIQVACIGRRGGMTTYCFEDDKILCGCWMGTLKKFKVRVKKTHKNNPRYLKEYLGFIKYIKSLKEVKHDC